MEDIRVTRRDMLLAATAGIGALAIPSPVWASGRLEVKGHCAPEFAHVRDVFQKSFDDGDEVGANVAVTVDGNLVVNLWGGHRDEARVMPWREDTLVCTMSVSKGITALAALILVDRGKLQLQERVAAYWPEFGQAGKEDITVQQLLSHMAALPVAERAPNGAALGWNELVRALEQQAPLWEPGTRGIYHPTTYGHLVGELVQRVSGRDIAEFVRDEIAHPLGAEFIFGCNAAEQARVAPPIPNPLNHHAKRNLNSDLAAEIYRLLGDEPRAVLLRPDFCKFVFPSASGVSNAHSLARIFAALASGGSAGGTTLLRPETLEAATREQWFDDILITEDRYRVALGFLLNGGIAYYGPNPRAFGSAGSGGYTVFADPDRRLSFAYTPNRFTSGDGLGIQSRRLVDAVYHAL